MFIKEARAGIIKNSRKEKTLQVEIKTFKGRFISSAPSGKSIGKYEIPAYNKRGIDYTLRMLEFFARTIENRNFMIKDFSGLKLFEAEIRRFEARYGRMGANAVYAIESCFLKAAAKENKKELWEFIHDSFSRKKPKIPIPVGNCMGGGLHSKKDRNSHEIVPDFQEFLLIPVMKKGEKFSRAITRNLYAYEKAKKIIKKEEEKWIVRRNNEGAWKTTLTNEEVLDILIEAAKEFRIRIGIDAASSIFYSAGNYYYKNKKFIRDKTEQIDYISRLADKYNLFYIEDPMNEEDFLGFSKLLMELKNKKILIAGDDLTATNLMRIRRAFDARAINAVIIKPNQTGSLIEVAKIAQFCAKKKIKMIFSHRSGETMDSALADFCVGFGGDFIKTGIYGRERLIKLKRIMDIEKVLSQSKSLKTHPLN